MPIIQSAIKRVRQEKRRKVRNDIVRRRYKELIKELEILMYNGKKAEAEKLFPQVQKAIDLAAKKHLLPANTAARRKSRLAKVIAGKAEVSETTKSALNKKAKARKTTSKKSSTEKATTKKTETKES